MEVKLSGGRRRFEDMILRAGEDDGGRRLDRVLRKALPGLPLSALHRLLRKGMVLVDGRPAKRDLCVFPGAVISLPEQAGHAGCRKDFSSKGALDILWEGPDLLILNKPPGLAVHGGEGETLESRARSYLGEGRPSLSFRPGPLHRLDKPSSGVLVFSVTLRGARFFSALLRDGRLCKRYLAILDGNMTKAEVWEDRLRRDKTAGKTFAAEGSAPGRRALTRVRPLKNARDAGGMFRTLVLAEIETGRTHQIRSQAAHHGRPLSGDRKYGGRPLEGPGRFFLHAAELEFPGPEDAPGEIRFPPIVRAPLPEDFKRITGDMFGLSCDNYDTKTT